MVIVREGQRIESIVSVGRNQRIESIACKEKAREPNQWPSLESLFSFRCAYHPIPSIVTYNGHVKKVFPL
jgi:hypothetical protein